MDPTAHYRQLARLGRAAFLGAAAPAALLRYRTPRPGDDLDTAAATLTLDEPVRAGVSAGAPAAEAVLEVVPLLKKPGAAYPDRITVGRTSNNDVVLPDHAVSRLHVYFRVREGRWFVADAGSKNGATVDGVVLAPRKEQALVGAERLRLGELELLFVLAEALYELLRS